MGLFFHLTQVRRKQRKKLTWTQIWPIHLGPIKKSLRYWDSCFSHIFSLLFYFSFVKVRSRPNVGPEFRTPRSRVKCSTTYTRQVSHSLLILEAISASLKSQVCTRTLARGPGVKGNSSSLEPFLQLEAGQIYIPYSATKAFKGKTEGSQKSSRTF